jgi:DNA polymerase-3 subunit beta
LQRAAILSNEKYPRGEARCVAPGQLRIVAHNPEQEEAVEEIEAETVVDQLERRVQRELPAGCAQLRVRWKIRCASICATATPAPGARVAGDDRSRHVVMPLRL